MKSKFISIGSVIFLAFTGLLCAQTKNGIIKVTAYQQEISGGNIPVDMDGKAMRNGSDTSLFLIIETTAAQLPNLQKAYRNGLAYSLTLSDSTQNNQAGLMTDRGQLVKAAKGNRLWRYDLVRAEDNKVTVSPPANTISLTGKFKGKNITIPVQQIVTLAPQQRP